MSRFDGMVALGITILVDEEVNFLFILSCDILPNYHYERHRLSPFTENNYPMGIHIGSQAVADDWSMILVDDTHGVLWPCCRPIRHWDEDSALILQADLP